MAINTFLSHHTKYTPEIKNVYKKYRCLRQVHYVICSFCIKLGDFKNVTSIISMSRNKSMRCSSPWYCFLFVICSIEDVFHIPRQQMLAMHK